MIKIEIQDRSVLDAFNRLLAATGDPSPAMKKIAGILHDRTMQNFVDQSGPSGKWEKFKHPPKDGHPLLRDTGRLAASITTASGADFAQIGTNTVYAAIHQFGGKIGKAAQSRQVRHRTDAKGNLLRSEHLGGKGLIFAKNSDKRAVGRWFEQGAHEIDIPARPFLPFLGNQVQEGVEAEVLGILQRYIQGAAEG